ncbi:MAG: peptide MFS transporter [Gammaproteobacteria bacterium]
MQQHRGYPCGFWPLFGSEVVSRFGFWAIQALLVLYLIQFFHFTDNLAYSFFASYCALTYAVTIMGGIIADKFLGFKQPVIIGAFIIMIGSLVLTIPNIQMNEIALSLLILGTGLMIPNIANFIGALYSREDTQRDKGFSTFYIATNLGGLGGPILGGFISKFFGWQAAFVAISFFMLIWLVIFALNYKKYVSYKHPTTWLKRISAYSMMLVVAIISYVLLRHAEMLGYLLTAIFVLALCYVFYISFKTSLDSKVQLIFIVACILLALYFFTFEFQILTSFIIFTQKFVNHSIFGFQLPVASIVAIEPLFVVLLIPVINSVFDRLDQASINVTQFQKITYGLACLSLCFLVFAMAAQVQMHTEHSLSLLWIFGGLIIMAIGEVLIMPPLLSVITKDAPDQLKGTLVGVLYLAIALSGYLAGQVAKLTESYIGVTKITVQTGYYHTYLAVFVLSMVLATALYVAQRHWSLKKI